MKFACNCLTGDDGHVVSYVQAAGSEYLSFVYRVNHLNYPRFFKMDDLSKVGFLAVEGLELYGCLNGLDAKTTAVVFFSNEASLPTDRQFEDTIKDSGNFFPSPSIFVYTLPNILCGEVCIRHGFQGESGLYVIEKLDWGYVKNICLDVLAANSAVVCGVVDYDKGSFYARAEVFTMDYLLNLDKNG